MRRIVAALLILIAGAASAAERLTVDQAVAAALAHNASVASARLEVEKAQTRIDAARTKRLPSLNVDAMGGEALSNLSIEVRDGAGDTTRVDLARTFNLFAVVRLTQPITQLHAINLGVKMQETSLAADRERERAARLVVTREVKRAYSPRRPTPAR
jgi:outer membrane protein TolC